MEDSSKETKKIIQVNLEHMDWKEVLEYLKMTQDFWWLTEEIDVDGKNKTKLEIALIQGISFKKEKVFEKDMEVKLEPGDRTPVKIKMESNRNELFAPKNWLTPENHQKYIRRTVEILKKYKEEKGHLDKHTDEAFEELKEELRQINESNTSLGGHRKPHTAFVAYKKNLRVKRGDAWSELKEYAKTSKGETQIDLPGYGQIYLKLNMDVKIVNLMYKESEFTHSTDGCPITRKAFDSAWDD